MTVSYWEPLRELNTLFNTVFDGPRDARRWMPAMDLAETTDHYVLKADLPGLKQENLSIEVEDTKLTISGERAPDPREGHDGFFRLERPFGRFSRSLTLPKGVDAEAVTAAFTDGVLEVNIPKPVEAKPRRIEIAVGDQPATIEAGTN